MGVEEILSDARVNSEADLYSKLDEASGAKSETVETELPGEVNISPEGLLHYQGTVEISAVAGEVTVARNEDSEIYWMTDGDITYWVDSDGGINKGDDYRLEQLHRLGNKVLEPEGQKDELRIEGQQPGIFTSGPLQHIPKQRRGELRRELEKGREIDMVKYTKGLNEDSYETAESMARELNKKLRRASEFEGRAREETILKP